MIQNEKQYEITTEQLGKFKRLREKIVLKGNPDPIFRNIEKISVESEIKVLEDQVKTYDKNRKTISLAKKSVPSGGKLLFLAIGGSNAYGLNTPESDIDLRGVYMTNKKKLLGLSRDKGTIDGTNPDFSMHELGKFCKLALACNPNVVEQLFLEEEDILYVDPSFYRFLKHKDSFLSKRAAKTYGGYAISQLKRLESPGTRKMGEKRKALRDKYGYDPKNAMHCMRLLWQGNILLSSGELRVKFEGESRDILMEIRSGEWTYQDFKDQADQWTISLNEAEEESNLPAEPDSEIIETLLMEARLEYILHG